MQKYGCVQKLGKEHIGKVSIQKRLFTAIALIMTLLLAGCSAIGSNGHRGSLDVDYIANGDEGEDRLNQLKGLAAENDTPEPDDKLRTPAPCQRMRYPHRLRYRQAPAF